MNFESFRTQLASNGKDTVVPKMKKTVYRMMQIAVTFLLVMMSEAGISTARGENGVEYLVSDTIVASGLPEFKIMWFGNSGGRSVDIAFDLISPEPFTVYKVEWVNLDTVRHPIEPFSLIAKADTVTDKAIIWHIKLEFPYTQYFGESDQLKIYTDKGTITSYTLERGSLNSRINEMTRKHDEYVEKSEHREWIGIIVIGVAAVILLAVATWLYLAMRRRMARQYMEIEELSTMIEERTQLNLELRNKVNALYMTRLDTLNKLCEGYFNNKDSDKTKHLFYKEVENSILALRDNKSLEELEGIVNEYLDDTIARVRRQIPDLSVNDLKFLTYIYAGFSPRAVCVFMNIKIKTFYNRRNLLKERILASDAPDREYFVSLMAS